MSGPGVKGTGTPFNCGRVPLGRITEHVSVSLRPGITGNRAVSMRVFNCGRVTLGGRTEDMAVSRLPVTHLGVPGDQLYDTGSILPDFKHLEQGRRDRHQMGSTTVFLSGLPGGKLWVSLLDRYASRRNAYPFNCGTATQLDEGSGSPADSLEPDQEPDRNI